MEKLPVETLIQIFRAACIDGGYTGCSLSRTSRAVRAASQPTRFYSIALSIGFSRLESFITLYQTLRVSEDGSRAKVIHLHLEDDEEDSEDDLEEDYRLAPSRSQAVRLLHLIADDLVSLVLPSILMMSSPIGDQLTDRPFPVLKALVVNVPADNGTYALTTSAVSPVFPVLTHALIVMAPYSLAPAPFSAWNTHAPRATHVRISSCPLVGTNLEDIRLLLGVAPWVGRKLPSLLPAGPPPAPRPWPSVRHVAVQPIPVPKRPRGRMMMYGNLRFMLSCMVDWAKNEENRTTLESARILEPKPSWPSRSGKEWRVAIRETWARLVTSGVDSDWLTWGEVEPTDSDFEE